MRMSTGDLQKLDSGSNSSIYRFQDSESKESLVFKVVATAHRKEAEHLLNEYRLLSKLDHFNIIYPILFKPNVAFEGENNHVLVLKCAQQGSLLQFIKNHKLTVEESRFVFKELCHAVDYLHSSGVVHRDLKLENVLVFKEQDQLQFKLADFGFAEQAICDGKQKLVKGMKGTKRGYMAPEIHCSAVSKDSYKAKNSDVFALGVMKLPFEYATKQNVIYRHIYNTDFEAFWNHHAKDITKKEVESGHTLCTEDLKSLLERMICQDPDSRYSLEQILDHPWLKAPALAPKP